MEEIGKILPLVFKRQVRSNDARVIQILAPLWPRVAGKPMAQHSKPVTFDNGILTLESDCSTWSAQLRAIAEEIRAGINDYLGQPVVRKLHVRYAPKAAFPSAPGQPGTRTN